MDIDDDTEDGIAVADVLGGGGGEDDGFLLVLEVILQLVRNAEEGEAHILVTTIVANELGGVGVVTNIEDFPVSRHDGFTVEVDVVSLVIFLFRVFLVVRKLDVFGELDVRRPRLVLDFVELDVNTTIRENGFLGSTDDTFIEFEVGEDTILGRIEGGDEKGNNEKKSGKKRKMLHGFILDRHYLFCVRVLEKKKKAKNRN